MKANKDSKISINENDAEFVHVELKRLTVIPGDEKHPIEHKWVQQFDVKTFERFFNTGNEQENRKFLNVMNVDEARIVHDPRNQKIELTDEEKAAKAESDAKAKEEVLKSAAEKRAATNAAKKAAKATEK